MNLFTQIRKTKVPDIPDLEEFMTTKEASEKLGLHVKTIPRMVRDGVLEGVRFGRDWLVSRKSVAEYMKKTAGMSKRDPRRKANPKK